MTHPPRGERTSDHTSADPRRTLVADLRRGDRLRGGVLLVDTLNFKQTRDGKHFLQMVLRDRTGSIRAVRWEASRTLYRSISEGGFVRATGRVEEFQQKPQLIVDDIEPVADQDIDPEDFLPASPRDIAEMERELLEHIAAMDDDGLRALLKTFLEDPEVAAGIRRCPAGKTLHHARLGGLLEHILSLIGAVSSIAQNYPQLDRDLLVAAAVLHDVGKIRELDYRRSFSYTDEGQLVGHLGIALAMMAQKAPLVPELSRTRRLHLEHIIASHHGLPEHGAVKTPMTPEAIAFHFLDNLDAKLAMLADMREELEDAPGPDAGSGLWTEYKPVLGRRIWFEH